MALTKVTVKRAVQASGNDFLTLQDGSSRLAQAVGLVDELGDHAGIDENPIYVRIEEPDPPVKSGGIAVKSYLLMDAPGLVGEIRVQLDPAVTFSRYLMLFDSLSVPINGTVPVWSMLVPAGGQASESVSRGIEFPTNGCMAVLSSTPGILTITAANECYIYASRRIV